MNAQHHGQSPKGIAPKSVSNFAGTCVHQLATLTGLNQRAVFIAVVNSRNNALHAVLKGSHEPELVMP